MRRMSTIARALALALAWAGPSVADDPPKLPPLPSGQSAPAGSAYPLPGGPGLPGDAGTAGASNPDGSPSAATADAGAGAGAGGFTSELGGSTSGSGAPPGIVGDYTPITRAVVHASSRFPVLPTPVPPPRVGGRNPGIVNGNGTTSILFKLTGLKVSDNQSPVPQDRVFFSFNYFDNLNASADRKTASPIQNLQVYHELFGIEKTFLDGNASIGFRVPLNTISFKSDVAGLGGSSTAPGDLSVFLKYAFYRNRGTLFSTGLQVTAPTGPGAFGGAKYYSYFRDAQIQPFVGYLFRRDRFYAQGFTSINVPTQSQDVTLFFEDVAIGYYAYRSVDPTRFLTAIVPTAEAHLNIPLNHRGYGTSDLAGTPDILDMTFGTNLEFRRRTILSVAYVTPVTGPKPFNAELVLLLNIRFGGSRRNLSPINPPPLN